VTSAYTMVRVTVAHAEAEPWGKQCEKRSALAALSGRVLEEGWGITLGQPSLPFTQGTSSEFEVVPAEEQNSPPEGSGHTRNMMVSGMSYCFPVSVTCPCVRGTQTTQTPWAPWSHMGSFLLSCTSLADDFPDSRNMGVDCCENWGTLPATLASGSVTSAGCDSAFWVCGLLVGGRSRKGPEDPRLLKASNLPFCAGSQLLPGAHRLEVKLSTYTHVYNRGIRTHHLPALECLPASLFCILYHLLSLSQLYLPSLLKWQNDWRTVVKALENSSEPL
jgi:hypothetical protein